MTPEMARCAPPALRPARASGSGVPPAAGAQGRSRRSRGGRARSLAAPVRLIRSAGRTPCLRAAAGRSRRRARRSTAGSGRRRTARARACCQRSTCTSAAGSSAWMASVTALTQWPQLMASTRNSGMVVLLETDCRWQCRLRPAARQSGTRMPLRAGEMAAANDPSRGDFVLTARTHWRRSADAGEPSPALRPPPDVHAVPRLAPCPSAATGASRSRA